MDYSSQKKGGLVPISPSQTPRSSEKYSRDFRSADSFNGKNDKDKGVNVQVILRCRPLNEDELRVNTPVVISCNEHKREVSASQNIANKQIDRTFAFDKVFGQGSQQKDLYNQAIVPIVNEVLEGYNCTIFAYGQTGTGKTYTMEGGSKKAKNGDFPIDAGVIPRAVRQIFEILEVQHAEYSMKVTFLELYNEEITDLLALPYDYLKFSDDKQKKPIALMEDGKGGVFVRGLEEEIVCTANEIYKILEKGSAKRRTAETLLNKQSSRSHSIFSITIHIKESTPEGEELIKCGKLNLVDLAGSENISRSGAREGRAREAGEINKSLLTLGRVINSLVEHSGHVPYRESKLTRLLRDSLGGKTKTCIIATISPSIHCIEETLSTLDYAHRAKNIKNRPEVNQKMMKSAMIKDLYGEIDRLKQEVYAAREKNGIYIPHDRYLQEESEKKAMSEKIERMELDLEAKDKQLAGLQELYDTQQELVADLTDKLEKCQSKLVDTEHALSDLEERYKQANATIKEKEYLISNLLRSEKALVERAIELRIELENATTDLSSLFAKIERKDKIEQGNRVLVQKFQGQLVQRLELLHRTVSASVMQQEQQLKGLEEDMQAFVTTKAETTEGLRDKVEKLKIIYGSGVKTLDDLTGELEQNSQTTFGRLNSQVSIHSNSLEDLLKRITVEAEVVLNELQDGISKQERKLTFFVEQQRQGHFRTIEATSSISKIAVDFFKTLDTHASKISQLLEENQTCQDKKLCELEKKFEVCAVNEEKLVLEKVAELLASSSARQKKLVQTAVLNLRESAVSRTDELQVGVSSIQDFTSSIKDQWTSYVGKMEKYYVEDTAALESGKHSLEEDLHECMKQTRMARDQWRNAQDSLLNLDKLNVEAVGSIVRSALEANQDLRAKLSSAASTVLEDVNTENESLLTSIDDALNLDKDACVNVDSTIVPCFDELRELRSCHFHKTVEINEQAGESLQQEYAVDEPTCTTPRRRPFNLPSIASIEELSTPPFEELIRAFWDTKSGRLPNGDAKQLVGMHDTQYFRDSRAPLTAIN